MRTKILLMITIIVLASLTACVHNTTKEQPVNNASNEPAVNNGAEATISLPSPSASPIPSSMSNDTVKADNSVRAIGTHSDGQLLVRPASKATVVPLGAPSCYGQETDLNWSGDYEAIWKSQHDTTSSTVMTFPIDFEIIEPNDTPVEMQKITMGEAEIFVYIPRYTDCHSLETYLFGVSHDEAFPITFEMNSEQILASIGQLPHRSFQISSDELILTGGYGAGQDFINVYHFRYDSKKQSMVLHNTEQVKPDDIVYDQ